jgi:hypothetical protein
VSRTSHAALPCVCVRKCVCVCVFMVWCNWGGEEIKNISAVHTSLYQAVHLLFHIVCLIAPSMSLLFASTSSVAFADENLFVDKLPWLVEVSTGGKRKRARPKIVRTFPWTYDTHYDANVLHASRSHGNILKQHAVTTKNTRVVVPPPLTLNAAKTTKWVGMTSPRSIPLPKKTLLPPSGNDSRESDVPTLTRKALRRHSSANTVMLPIHRRARDHTNRRRSHSVGGRRPNPK